LWAGLGAVRTMAALARRTRRAPPRAMVRLAGIALAVSPVALNWSAMNRRAGVNPTAAGDSAEALLESLPRNGILLAAGDNDTYPLWYAQRVEAHRVDVTVVTIPLLATEWYRAEIARRYSLLDSATTGEWHGMAATVDQVCRRAREKRRAVALAPNVVARRLPPSCHPGSSR